MRPSRQRATLLTLSAIVALGAFGACTDDGADGDGSDVEAVVAGESFPDARCEANRAAGSITYLSGFDFAATASIIDVIVADAAGYYDELCLDVELQPSFAPANYPVVASGDAQFASGGSFTEVVEFAEANDADLVAVTVEGRTPIDVLIVKPGEAEALEDLAGSTIGVKTKITPSVAAMLASAGMIEGEEYDTVLLGGFDPLAHIEIDGISAFPGYKSNEPGQLERAGIDFDVFDPADLDIPGSFGVIYTTRDFLDENPTAVQDFARATMRGLADALDDPDAAAAAALELIEANDNPNFLSLEGETFRWSTDVELITAAVPTDTGVGVPDADALQEELTAYAEIGLFEADDVPQASDRLDPTSLDGVYGDDGTVIWPG